MRHDNQEAAAAAIVEGELAVSNLAELRGRLGSYFARVEPHAQAGKYVAALLSELPRKNGWSIAEHAGDARPDRTQRLLNHAVWDEHAAMAAIRGFVIEHLGEQDLRVAALDESAQEKQGEDTAGAQRQYLGCVGKVANGVNTVYCSYATPAGHALVGARTYLPAGQVADPQRRAELGIDEQTRFRTKPQLGIEILADRLRADPATLRLRTDEAVARYLAEDDCWHTYAVPGSKGPRRYRWAWLVTSSDRQSLLIRQHLGTGELAYHYCHISAGWPVQLATLVRVACLRWPVEEDFEFSKDHFGLDHSQVRRHTALLRHTVLTMAALAVTAAHAKSRANTPILPTELTKLRPTTPD